MVIFAILKETCFSLSIMTVILTKKIREQVGKAAL